MELPNLVRRRLRLAALVSLVAFTIVWARFFYLQVIIHPYLASLAAAQYKEKIVLPPTRGIITDRYGNPLVLNDTVYNIYASPSYLNLSEKKAVASRLSKVLGISYSNLLKQLMTKSGFVYLAKGEPQSVANAVSQLDLPTVGVQQQTVPYFMPGAEPDTSIAANLIGFVDANGVGQYGVEGYYNKLLAGTPGYIYAYRDIAGNPVATAPEKVVQPKNGYSLELSLNSNIQLVAEQALATAVKKYGASWGSLIVLNTHTGGIIAYADFPSFNANKYYTYPTSRFFDHNISGLYEPGSVMKVVTLSGALDDGAITPNYSFDELGYWKVDGYTIRDWDLKAHGWINMTYVLEQSLNVGAIKAESLEGNQKFYHYLKAFGFGRPTGVDLQGETYAPLKPLSQWPQVQIDTASFGQGIDVTPIQMVTAVNAVANDGILVEPHAVRAIINPQTGKVTYVKPKVDGRVISVKAAEEMKQMMNAVVADGSGWTAQISGYVPEEAGKTGTSNIPVNGHYTGMTWASYAGFMPLHNTKFTMLVIIDNPKILFEGTFCAAPVWKVVAKALIDWYHIPPAS
jgi:stage V sporulation protein D (sporulation-specific penicillin-binding protein)